MLKYLPARSGGFLLPNTQCLIKVVPKYHCTAFIVKFTCLRPAGFLYLYICAVYVIIIYNFERGGDGLMEKKVLFLRFSSLGDVIFANYTAMRIKEKHPEFHLTWMTDSMYAGIVRAQPWIDDVIEWDRKNTGNRGYREILKKVRRMGFDMLIDMHGSDRSSLFSLFSGIKTRYCVNHRFPFTHTNFDFSDLMDMSLDIADCPKFLSAPPADLKIPQTGCHGRRSLGLAIGASAAVKRWPIVRWIEFCRLASNGEYMLYLIGSGSEEVAMAQEIINGVPSSCIINMVGRTSITESITLAAQMDVVISGDTGLMHIARALGVPVVGLFGPNFPGVESKRYVDSLGARFVCRCPEAGCEKLQCSRQCLEDISAVEVWNAAARITA